MNAGINTALHNLIVELITNADPSESADELASDIITAISLSYLTSAMEMAMVGEPKASEPKRFRHKKRGSVVVEIGRGRLQAEWLISVAPGLHTKADMQPLVAYRHEDTGDLWFRPPSEFDDGRFEALP